MMVQIWYLNSDFVNDYTLRTRILDPGGFKNYGFYYERRERFFLISRGI